MDLYLEVGRKLILTGLHRYRRVSPPDIYRSTPSLLSSSGREKSRIAKSIRGYVFGAGILSAFLLIALAGGSLFVHPASAATAPSVSYVVVIMMENRNYADIIGSTSAPYLNQLASTYGISTNY